MPISLEFSKVIWKNEKKEEILMKDWSNETSLDLNFIVIIISYKKLFVSIMLLRHARQYMYMYIIQYSIIF